MSRPVRAALALALSFSLLSTPALAQRPGRGGAHGGMPGGGLTPAGNPSALIAAEIAFARLAREKGQWTAFRETADDDAEMFTPRRVVAKDWLKGRKDPAQAVQWETHRAYASCDGSFGVTYGGWTGGADAGWTIGERLRTRGSLLSDSWSGTAAQLANRGQLAIFPAMGWWRNRPTHGRFERAARYSLVVSIEAPAVEQDLYASVAQQIGVPVAIAV